MEHFFNARIHKHAHLVDVVLLPDLGGGHVLEHITRTFGVENESCERYSHVRQLCHLFWLCHAAYFYSHIVQILSVKCIRPAIRSHWVFAAFNSCTNASKAWAGLADFMKFSPMRKPLIPLSRNTRI